MSTITIRDFDPANYLDNDEVIVEYLKTTAENPNPEVFLGVFIFSFLISSTSTLWQTGF